MQLRTAGVPTWRSNEQPRGVRRGNVQVENCDGLGMRTANVNPFDERRPGGQRKGLGYAGTFRPSTNGRLGGQSSREGD